MITLAKCKELLEQQEGVADVEVCKEQYLRGHFTNPVNPKEPHDLIVHPIPEKLVVRVLVPGITKIRSSKSELFRILQDVNYNLLIGKVGTDAHDGEVMLEINHPCQDGETADPSPDVFARLVEMAIETARDVHLTVTHAGMVEAGVPSDVAARFVDQFRQQESEGDGEDTL